MNGSTSTTSPAREELAVCVVCLHLLANGEYDDGTDAAERAGAGLLRRWGDLAARIVADGTDLGFRATACEGCGDPAHGDRYRAVLLPAVAIGHIGVDPVDPGVDAGRGGGSR